MIQSVLPYPPTEDVDEVNRIKKLSEYVARNGPEFEAKVKEKEVGNSAFSFLSANDNFKGHQFYMWLLFCAKHFYTQEQVEQIELEHVHRIGEASVLGAVDLTQEDYSYFLNILAKNSGSKESIKELRNWFLGRSHSAASIIFLFVDHMKNLCLSHINNPEQGLFKNMLHTVYAINDIMFNSAAACTEGPYTRYDKKVSLFFLCVRS
jgi:hypothetical protein